MATVTISNVDRLGKTGSLNVPVADASTTPQLQALNDALDAISIGSDFKMNRNDVTEIDQGSAASSTDQGADRGKKYLMRMQDSVNGKIFRYEVPCQDDSVLPSASSDTLDLTVGVGATLKAAIEAVYESPYGNSGVLISVQQITRTD